MRSALCCVPPASQLPGRTKYRKSMKRNLSLLLVSLLLQGQLLPKNIIRSVQPDTIQKSSEKSFRKQRSPRTDHGPVGINISLWKNISTQRTDTIGSTCFNLGVFSSMNRLNGLGMNILGSVTGRDVNGVQMAGLSNMVGEACEACR